MKRYIAFLLLAISAALGFSSTAHGLASDPKLFISADNTFYAYVKAGESIGASFNRVNIDEPFDTSKEDVTITVDGPGVSQQKCVAQKNVPIGQGCQFARQTAQESGIWRIQFAVPSPAKSYYEVSPGVRWGKNLFTWNISVTAGTTEQKGRIWTERYAIRQQPAVSSATDLNYYYISEDGYIYRALYKGYNGQISTLSADAIGIRKGTSCVSAYQSSEVSNTEFSPALGSCGNAYKLFFEEPAGELPAKAKNWEDKEDWVRPGINRPSIAELNFASDKSTDQQSGTISFYLRNFIGQYQVKIDTNNNGSFDDQNDVTINRQMKRLDSGLQRVAFDGADKSGQVIPTSQPIGIEVVINKAAEIHLVSADLEGRSGGLELTRLSGDNAPTTGLCWNDRELTPIAASLMPEIIDGTACPSSVGGAHAWPYGDGSWGNARYIDDWVYASAKFEGDNQIVFPESADKTDEVQGQNGAVIVVIVAGVVVIAGVAIAVFIVRRHRQKPPQLPPLPPGPGDPQI